MIKIYKAEKDAGLVDKIKASSSIAYLSPLEPLDPNTAYAKKLIKVVASQEHPEDTLFPMKDVLVTTGWNANTDVFDLGEVWIARYTPENHPLNFEHDEKRIVGHITTSQAVDFNFNLLSDELSIDDLPDKFHIINGSVIYKVWTDKEQQELIDKTIAEILKGEWYVSMECLFKGFDYAVIRSDGSKAIISRNQDSAFLTKYLRQYGGAGIYRDINSGDEFQLGRVLRNITFIGKGLVRRPANPESVIFSNISDFLPSFVDLGYIYNNDHSVSVRAETKTVTPESASVAIPNDESEKNKMSQEHNPDIQKLEEKVAQLIKDNESLTNQLKARDGEVVRAEIVARDKQIEVLKAKIDELNVSVASMTKQVEITENEKAKAEDSLTKLRHQARISLLISKGASEERANALVQKFTKLTDEEFSSIVEDISSDWKKPAEIKNPENVIDEAAKAQKKEPSLAVKDDINQDESKARIARASKLVTGFLHYNKNVPLTGE